MSLVKLSDQIALWNEWYDETSKKPEGATPEWEARLLLWDRRVPLDGDLWVRLMGWKKAKNG